jgi:hypothetical protein
LKAQIDNHIQNFERQFFEEEDSEEERALQVQFPQDEALVEVEAVRQQYQQRAAKSYIQQFWSIPLSIDIKKNAFRKAGNSQLRGDLRLGEFDWDSLIDAQQKAGGRMFDVITCDPPWQLSSANPTRGVAIAYSTLND